MAQNDVLDWLNQQEQPAPSGGSGNDVFDWMNQQQDDGQPQQDAPADLPQGANSRQPMSRHLAPDNYVGMGDAFYGDPGGQVGGFGVVGNAQREAMDYIAKKQGEFHAKVYVKQDDGSYTLEDANPLQKANRLAANALGTVGDIFNLGAKGMESVFGLSRGIEDLADMANSPLPDILKQDTGVNLFLQPALNVYNALRIATGTRQLTSDEILQTVDANLQASKIAYSTVAEPLLREEFIRRYLAGENPDFLAKELENPWHELAGQVVLDPLNVIGSFAAKAGKVATIEKMTARYGTVLKGVEEAASLAPEFKSGVMAGLRAMDTARAAEVIPDLAKVISSEALKVSDGLKQSKGLGNAFERTFFTSTARRESMAEHVSAVAGPLMAQYGNDPDSAAETIRALTLLGSGDATKTEDALRILRGAPVDLSKIILSQGGMETANVLHRMYGVDGMDKFMDLVKSGDKEKLAIEFTKKMDKAAAELYPTVTEKVDALKATIKAGGEGADVARKELDNIPSWTRAINDAHTKAQKVYAPLSTFFGDVYIVAQPGVQVRNVLGNMTHAFVDFGPGAALDIARNSLIGLKNVATKSDALLPAEKRLIELLGALPQGATKSLGAMNDKGTLLPKIVTEAAAMTEHAGSAAVSLAAAEASMRTALKEGLVTPRMGELMQTGLSQPAAEVYIDLLQNEFFGDHAKAWAKVQQQFSNSTVETWRNVEKWANPADLKNWEQSGILPAIQDAAKSGSLDEAMLKADAVVQKQLEVAAGIFDETPAKFFDDGLDNMDLAGPTSDLQTTHTLKRMAASNAKEEFRKMAFDILNDPQAPPELRQQLFDFTEKSGAAGQKLAASVVNAAENAKKAVTNGDPLRAWNILQNNQFGKTLGPIPDSLRNNPAALGDFIWDTWARPTRSKIWMDVSADTKKTTVTLAQQALEAMGKDPKTLLQSPEYLKAEQAFQYSQKVETAQYVSGKGLVFDGVNQALNVDKKPVDAIRALANRYGVRQTKGDQSLLATINKYGGETKYTAEQFNKGEIPFEEAQAAFQKMGAEKGIAPLADAGERLPIPRHYTDDTMPSAARVAAEGLSSTTQSMERFKSQLQRVWGQGDAVERLTPEIEAAMEVIGNRTTQRMLEARVISTAIANETRNFTLLNYSKKTYLDLALAYVMPYGFFQTHTTANWMKRLITNPEIAAGYFKYRKAMEHAHANLPDWWKYNINTNDLPGMKSDHPLMFNLEATLNPLNGLTGVDFTDPDKIVGEEGSAMRWWTSSLDAAGKFGPSIFTPITMLTAAGLYLNGEKNAAARWAGRLIPQTATIKAVSAQFGQPLELDPAVNILGGGKDPYEASRIGRAMAAMIQEGTPEAAALSAMHDESGPLYEEAYRRAVKDRSPYQIASFFGGTGFKARTPDDMKVDQFHQAYRNFWASSKNLSPDEFNTGMQKLHETYPFMDSVLLSKKDGLDRDRGYAYAVMTRIPPGYSTEVGEAVGLDPRLLDKFYEDKGDTKGWTKSDRDIFFAKIVDIGAVLDVPKTGVRQEWMLAKNEYLKMGTTAKGLFGENIDELVNGFYAIDPDNRNQYITQHPVVQQYLDWKAQYVVQEPLLSIYYNGMGQLRNYYEGKFRGEAEKTFGAEIYDTIAAYYSMKDTVSKKEYDTFYKQHPEIKRYYELKQKWDGYITDKVVKFGLYLPEGIPPQIRPDAPTGTGASFGQQDLQQNLQQQGPQWQDVASTVADDLKNDLAEYFQSGKPLTYATQQRLTSKAKQLGMSLEEFLLMAGQAIEQ